MSDDAPQDAVPRPKKKRGAAGEEYRRATGEILKPKYLAGASLRTLAEEHDLSYGYVHSCLLAAGVTLRDRGSNRFPGRVLSTND